MSCKRILLVEDEMLIALDIEATLHQLGHEVFSATTVAEALKHLEHGVDLAILDFQLKAGDTTGLAHHLRNLGIPFIACSGNVSLDDLGAAFAGASFLPKPFSTDGLLNAVAKAAAYTEAVLSLLAAQAPMPPASGPGRTPNTGNGHGALSN